MAIKLGNIDPVPSDFGWLRRRSLEAKLMRNSRDKPIFYFIYRTLMQAVADNDQVGL